MRPKESELAKLTDFQIRGLAGLLGFSGALKGYIKSELPAVFLTALDDHCEGEMPDHVWRIGKTRTDKDSLVSLRQRVAIAARESSDDPSGRTGKKGTLTKGSTSSKSPHPRGSPDIEIPRPRRSERLARKSIQMELDESDSDDAPDAEDGSVPRPPGDSNNKGVGTDTLECLRSLASDLKAVHTVLDQVHRLASGSRRSKDLALTGLQDEISQACNILQRLRTGMEVGRVCHTVQEAHKEKKRAKQEIKKPLSYAEAARRGVTGRISQAPRGAAPWSTTRTFFLRPEDDATRTREIPAWMFGAKLRQKFGNVPDGGDPPLLRLHRTARGEWQLLVAAWVRDKIVAANQNRFNFEEFGWWILERREVLSGPSAVVSRVPLELSDAEVQQGLFEGARSLLDPQLNEMMKAIRVQRLKRRETNKEDPSKSTWVPGKSVRVIFPAEDLRQKFLNLGGIYLFWQYVPIREYVPPTYYCAVCKKRGGHSTQFHRGPAHQGPAI